MCVRKGAREFGCACIHARLCGRLLVRVQVGVHVKLWACVHVYTHMCGGVFIHMTRGAEEGSGNRGEQ